eukprot:3564_1
MGACTSLPPETKKHAAITKLKQCTSIGTVHNMAKCDHFQSFVITMEEFNQKQNINGNLNIVQILNHFIHIIHQHDEQFELMANTLGSCDINTCNIFTRNCLKPQHTKNNDDIKIMLMQKMHCYFQHCFDLGYRFTMKEEQLINKESKENDEMKESVFSINYSLLKAHEILSIKHSMLHKSVQDRINARYILPNINYNQESHNDSYPIFKYGYPFKYEQEHEKCNFGMDYMDNDEAKEGISMTGTGYTGLTPRYETLKTEITSNSICSLPVQQFSAEYKKAQIHFKTEYRKAMYETIHVENILSLLFYCNFTMLQYEFSKTYREDQGLRHDHFYWMGKYLKECLHRFGTYLDKGNIKQFYHGTGQKLLFNTKIYGLEIYCPLSTSSSKAVAVNFTNNNRGIIIQFNTDSQQDTFHMNKCKYFSVSWLSDYGNENEHLFVQNQDYLRLGDIIDATNGIEYKPILDALQQIDLISCAFCDLKNGIKDTWNEEICTKAHCNLLYEIIAQKVTTLPRNQSIQFPEYALKLIEMHFKNQKTLYIEHRKYAAHKCDNCKKLHELFYDSEKVWFQLEMVLNLYSDIKRLKLNFNDYKVDTTMIEDVLSCLFTDKTELNHITMISSDAELMKLCTTSKYQGNVLAKNVEIKQGNNVLNNKNVFPEPQRNWLEINVLSDESIPLITEDYVVDTMEHGEQIDNISIKHPKSSQKHANHVLKSWFTHKVQIPHMNDIYYQLFIDNGYDTMDIVKLLSEHKLKKIGITKQGHIDKIVKEIDILRNKIIDVDNQLKSWFDNKVQISHMTDTYLELFISNGYDTLHVVKLLSVEKLKHMGIKKQGHIDKIMMEVDIMKKLYPNYNVPQDNILNRMINKYESHDNSLNLISGDENDQKQNNETSWNGTTVGIDDNITFNSDLEDNDNADLHIHNGKIVSIKNDQITVELTHNQHRTCYFIDEIKIMKVAK